MLAAYLFDALLLIAVYLWFGCAIVAGIAAFHRERHALSWFVGALVFGPLALPAVLVMKAKKPQ